MGGSRKAEYRRWGCEGRGGLREVWFHPSSVIRDRSVHRRSLGLSFSKPLLAFLQVFIEQHGQVPDHER